MKYTIIFWTYHLRIKYLEIVTGQQMMILMLDIGSHLSFDFWMTLKRKFQRHKCTQISRKGGITL